VVAKGPIGRLSRTTRASSHPDCNRRSWNFTKSTVSGLSSRCGSRTITAGSDSHRPRSTFLLRSSVVNTRGAAIFPSPGVMRWVRGGCIRWYSSSIPVPKRNVAFQPPECTIFCRHKGSERALTNESYEVRVHNFGNPGRKRPIEPDTSLRGSCFRSYEQRPLRTATPPFEKHAKTTDRDALMLLG